MSLYGDKLTLTNAAGIDNLAKSAGFTRDNLEFTEGSGGADILTLAGGEGQGVDNLVTASGSGEDNLAKQSYTLTTEADTISVSPIDIDVEDTGDFPDSGSAKIYRRSDGTAITFDYVSKDATTFKSCTKSGSFAFDIGDMIETV